MRRLCYPTAGIHQCSRTAAAPPSRRVAQAGLVMGSSTVRATLSRLARCSVGRSGSGSDNGEYACSRPIPSVCSSRCPPLQFVGEIQEERHLRLRPRTLLRLMRQDRGQAFAVRRDVPHRKRAVTQHRLWRPDNTPFRRTFAWTALAIANYPSLPKFPRIGPLGYPQNTPGVSVWHAIVLQQLFYAATTCMRAQGRPSRRQRS